MSKNDFDFIAPFYDQLARVIFGRSIKKAQICFLDKIPDNESVLIMGGGTGWILEEMAQSKVNLTIDYVEASTKMIRKSKTRAIGQNQVNFICGTENEIPDKRYAVIITNFFLDVFYESRLDNVMSRIAGNLIPEGIWVCTDFQSTGKRWHKFLLWAMHRFFRISSNLESKRLANFRVRFKRLGFRECDSQEFYQGMIFSAIYSPTSQ